MKRWLILTAVALCCLAGFALGEEAVESGQKEKDLSSLYAVLPVQYGEAQVAATEVEGRWWLLLPSFANEETMKLVLDGKPVSLQDEALAEVGVLFSKNLRALFLFSDDPDAQGRAYIDGSEDHSTWMTGRMVMVNEDGRIAHTAGIEGMRGRGNSTWMVDKKPYHLELDSQMDLLDVGQPARKWALLADTMDGTMIRNILTLDLARELGIETTPHAEHVDLYYDGEYRGTYLLAEKVEVGESGVDELNYEKLLKRLNRSVGMNDLDELPTAKATNRYDATMSYTEGMLEASQPSSGAYLIELEVTAFPRNRCWFRWDGYTYTLKNPENASLAMLTYISERLGDARTTLAYGGVNPDNGRTVEDDFDVDAFARMLLLQELSCNPDSYERSSFFVLPAGEARFGTGPGWDFDLTWRYCTSLINADGSELQKLEGWMPDFYGTDAVWTRMGQVWREELYPLVKNVLLGDEQGVYLRSIDDYAARIEASRQMNAVLWDTHELSRFVYGVDYEEEIALLKSFLIERSEWFDTQLRKRTVDPEKVEIRIRAQYLRFGDQLEVGAYPWSRAEVVSFEQRQLSEATEDDYAVWQVDMAVSPAPGHTFVSPSVTVNGQDVEATLKEDGRLYLSVRVQDLSYRPADYYGEDMGMVFDADYYAAAHPDIAEECGYDAQLLLEYFCDEGVYEAHMGNAFFDPVEVARKNRNLREMLGEDYWTYYTEFIYYGHKEGWFKDGKTFLPPVLNE